MLSDGANHFFTFAGIEQDEPIFANGKVICLGQVIGVVLARNQPLAQRAAKAVKVTYKDLPSVITIEVYRTLMRGVQ